MPSTYSHLPRHSSRLCSNTSSWQTWRSGAFELKHPAGAVVRPDTDRSSGFVGQALAWSFSNSPPLHLFVSELPTSALELSEYVDSVREARNSRLDLPDWEFAVMPPAKARQCCGGRGLRHSVLW